MRHLPERRAVVAALVELAERGLNIGTSGNVGLRVAGGLLVSPSGVPAEHLCAGDVVELRADGAVREGRLTPTSEWRFHRDILTHRDDINAVVHVHSPHATALACLNRPIPPFHYLVALAGGSTIRVAGYATFGSQTLSDNVLGALEGRHACLMANHGLIATGRDLSKGVALAREVENLAHQYLLALQSGAEPAHLSEEQMAEVRARIASNGQSS
ncbi:MAG: class II aldolase/adducin family protein [Thiohalorhabdaceae bacterium]